MRYRVDVAWRRFGVRRQVVVGGSPLTLFRLGQRGIDVVDTIESGEPVADSALVERLLAAGAVHPDMEGRSSRRFALGDLTVVTPQFGGRAAADSRIVVDDGSLPPVAGATIRLDRNAGPGAARNAGRRAVDTDLVAFVDADVDLRLAVGGDPRSWAEPLLAHLDDPRVGLVAPRVVGDDLSSLDLGPRPARIRAGTRVGFVPAAAIVVRATAFDSIGGFDERLRTGEDVDFVWRLADAGWTCRYEPAVTVSHPARATFAARLRQQVGYGRSAAPLALRHPRALVPWRCSTWTALALVALCARRPLAALAVLATTSAMLGRQLEGVDARHAAAVAARGHLDAGRQLTTAMRRTWWPILALGSVVSRRVRLAGLLALLAAPRRAPIDIAHGVGVWIGMFRHRTLRPLVPELVGDPFGRPPPQSSRRANRVDQSG